MGELQGSVLIKTLDGYYPYEAGELSIKPGQSLGQELFL